MKELTHIEIKGAREHNLKELNLSIPKGKLVVITGVSGSGKSSLAFDTIYAEGQRRYIETFSSYARHFLGNISRPDVDKIDGLSPVIAIEQKTTNKSPRSTVGTITEVYDFLRLLFARIADSYSLATGKKMISYSPEEILELITKNYKGTSITILSPVVKSRKGHYREFFEQISKKGYLKVRIDGEITNISKGLKLDRYKIHDIEIVIDRISISDEPSDTHRLKESIHTALKEGGQSLVIESSDNKIQYLSRHLMCADTGISYPLPDPNTFSFNSPKGMCPNCSGLGKIHEVNLESILPNKELSILKGGIIPIEGKKNNWVFQQLETIALYYNFSLATPIKDIPKEGMDMILYGSDQSFSVLSKNIGVKKKYKIQFDGIVNFIKAQFEQNENMGIKHWAKDFMEKRICPSCKGKRLRQEALSFRINKKDISELSAMDIRELSEWFKKLPKHLGKNQNIIAEDILKEIHDRLGFLLDVGLHYLSLDRPSKSLSGGEAQRIRLAAQIGSQLVNVLYILDEPSIGLHQRDNYQLIKSLQSLRDIGNSVIVVEHDKDMILAADHIIDIGPKAGKHGGDVIFEGSPKEMLQKRTITADYISGEKSIPIPKKPRKGNKRELKLIGCTGNNLKNISVSFPLGKLIVVTGVSGSGKSTLINETLYPILNKHFFNAIKKPQPYKTIEGIENIDKVINIDQSPIGRTPRSNAATYTDVFSNIRTLFSQAIESQIRGYKPGRFSFNVSGGRCETCKGSGLNVIEMKLLPDVIVECETCQGKRFNRETLEIRYKNKSIYDVLNMTINEALQFFDHIPKIKSTLQTIQDVGLGYITLGQASTTLSGGEAQRIKLASELSKRDTGNTLYILDEPTTGLHFEDIDILLKTINRLVDQGNTAIIIEHNMDVIKVADHLIDIGPEGGKEGGEVVAFGTTKEIAENLNSHTGKFLQKEL